MPTTKNSYDRVMAMLSRISGSFADDRPAQGFLVAMVKAGYDGFTPQQLAGLMGWR